MPFAAFDLETAKILPPNVDDLKQHTPLGISCAAIALSDAEEPEIWSGSPQLTVDECGQLVDRLQALVAAGYTPVTWNGASFDFSVLAQESGRTEDCGELALGHVDLMLLVTFTKGWYLGLDKALAGAGLKGKVKNVALGDGTILADMSGAQAPALWKAGEHEAVLAYLKGDVAQLLALADVVQRTRAIRWLSNRGKRQSVRANKLMTVSECFQLPAPDTSWMSNAPARSGFVDWIPGWVDKMG